MARGKELDTVFPLNTIIAIREPRARKKSPTATGAQPYVEVDSPSDLVFLDPKDPVVVDMVWSSGNRSVSSSELSAEKWKEIENDHFKRKEFFAVAVAYTYALRQDPSFAAARLNRCLAHLRLSNFSASIHDADIALGVEDISKPDKIKAIARAAQAQYGSGDYEAAIKRYQEWLTIEPGIKDAVVGIKNCNARIQERDHGDYNWKQLLLECETPCARPDVAEYIGPIKVIRTEGQVKGKVVTTREVKAGDLLVSMEEICR
jgi:tetratricopeptide (TPR) repeat protein